jgi:hypothetical protein
MGGACDTKCGGGRNNGYRGLVGKPGGKNLPGKLRRRWEDDFTCNFVTSTTNMIHTSLFHFIEV